MNVGIGDRLIIKDHPVGNAVESWLHVKNKGRTFRIEKEQKDEIKDIPNLTDIFVNIIKCASYVILLPVTLMAVTYREIRRACLKKLIHNVNKAYVERYYHEVPEFLRVKIGKLHESLKSKNISWMSSKDNILQSIFTFSTQHLYAPLLERTDLKQKRIVVTGSVRNDGIGDYHHIIHTAEQIKKLYPMIQVDVIPVFMTSSIPNHLKILDPSQFQTLLDNSEDAITEKALKIMKEADLLFEVSQDILDKAYTKMKKAKGDAYHFIGEYDKTSGIAAMGLENEQLGIAIKEQPKSRSLLDLENKELKKILFNKSNPSQKDVNNYLQTHEPFMAYLKSGSYYQMTLIYTIAAYAAKLSKSTVDICIPEVDMEILDLEALKKLGFSRIKVVKNENGHRVEKEYKLAEEGKELRFINPYPLNQKDFYTLMMHSNPLVGCTGDHSLSEALSFNKLPFYEVRPMKKYFIRHLRNLAGQVGGPSHYLQQYFKELENLPVPLTSQDALIGYFQTLSRVSSEEKAVVKACFQNDIDHFKTLQPSFATVGQRIAELLQHPELFTEMSEFNELLTKHYNYNLILKDLVGRKLALQTYPELQSYENELFKKFKNEEIDAWTAQNLLKAKMASMKNYNRLLAKPSYH